MKNLFMAAALLIVLAGIAAAQNQIPERLLLSTGQYVGSGSRPMGMAGTYTGIADDYASIWWNPAGLAQIKRIEIQGTLARTGFGNKTDYYGGQRDGSTSSMRLNNAGVVFPVPVYQGAMSFAFGYNQLVAFDRRTRILAPQSGTPGYEAWSQNSSNWNSFDELEDGRLGLWTLAGAVDVSPNLALGLGLNYWSGVDDYSLIGSYMDRNTPQRSENTVTTDLGAFGANLGAMLRAGRIVRVGLMVQTPMSMSLEESWTDVVNESSTNGYFNYRMTYPAVLRLGASVAPGRWLVGADIEYRDWTTMQFRSDTPYSGVSKAEANQQIKDAYRATTRVSVGGEYLVPAYGVRLRGGYAYEPSPYKADGASDARNLFTGGVGVLVDRSVMFDVGLQFGSYKENITRGLTEDISVNNALFTISYRL